MNDEIKRRLEAAGVMVKPLIWIATGREDFNTYCRERFELVRFDPLQFRLRSHGFGTAYFESSNEAKAAADTYNRAAVLAHLEVADDALGA